MPEPADESGDATYRDVVYILYDGWKSSVAELGYLEGTVVTLIASFFTLMAALTLPENNG